MNILFLTSTFPRFPNDHQAPFVLEQALAWKSTRPQDNIFILAPDDLLAKREEKVGEINISRFQYFFSKKYQSLSYPAILPNLKKNKLLFFQIPFFLLAELIATVQMIQKYHIDMIYAHWVMPQGLIAYIASKLKKTPYVLQNHSSDIRIFNKMPLGRYFLKSIIRSSTRLFCVNSLLKKEALQTFGQDDQPYIDKKISVIPMGILGENPSSNSSEKINYTYDFGFIGRLSQKKGVDYFIKTLHELNKERISFRAAIAGDGEEKENLIKLANGLNVEFLGFLTNTKKEKFFENTKFLIFPSVVSQGDIEGLPVALLEALALGKPVLASSATNIQLLPEWDAIKNDIVIIDNPQNVDHFTEKLKAILNTPDEKIKRASYNLKTIINRYQWNNLIKEYIHLILQNH